MKLLPRLRLHELWIIFTISLLFYSQAALTANQDQGPERGTGIVPVPGVGELAILVFEHWDVKVDDIGQTTAIRLVNADRMDILLTCYPRPEPLDVDEADQKSKVSEKARQYVAGSIEQDIILKRLSTPIGNSILANFNDLRYQNAPPPPGKFSSITLGQVDHPLMTVDVVILTQGTETTEHDDALEVLATLLVTPYDE